MSIEKVKALLGSARKAKGDQAKIAAKEDLLEALGGLAPEDASELEGLSKDINLFWPGIASSVRSTVMTLNTEPTSPSSGGTKAIKKSSLLSPQLKVLGNQSGAANAPSALSQAVEKYAVEKSSEPEPKKGADKTTIGMQPPRRREPPQ